MKRLCLALCAVLLCSACVSEEDASDLTLFVTPSALRAESGEIIYFDIRTRTLHESIDKLEITSFDNRSEPQVLHAEEPRTSDYATRYYYPAPLITTDSMSVEITFRVTDNRSNTQTRQFRITVLGNTSLLPGREGVLLYSPHSGKPDGFSLTTGQTLRCATTPPEQTDIYLHADPEADPETLCREWRTKTDVLFAKANGYDYAAATPTSLSAYYAASRRYNYVDGLAEGDILLIGRAEQVWGVMLIVGIFDGPGAENDRYLINFKTIDPNLS